MKPRLMNLLEKYPFYVIHYCKNLMLQTDVNIQPTICPSADKINHRYYLNFDGSHCLISNIDFNPAVGAKDIVLLFLFIELIHIMDHISVEMVYVVMIMVISKNCLYSL